VFLQTLFIWILPNSTIEGKLFAKYFFELFFRYFQYLNDNFVLSNNVLFLQSIVNNSNEFLFDEMGN